MEKTTAANEMPEPWLRGMGSGTPAVQRAVVHALQQAREDLDKWCGELTDEEVNARPGGVAPVAFHLRHIARSLDRLLTYAEGRQLSEEQLTKLKTEMEPGAKTAEVLGETRRAVEKSIERVRATDAARLEEPRSVGRKHLPTTLGGLLVHCAEHTQRHVGQAVTTAKIVAAWGGKFTRENQNIDSFRET